MNWDDLRVFLALLRSRNLASAAKELGVDRSTVSRRLAALEESLGAALFLRTREGLRPTAPAERLRGPAEQMEALARGVTPGALGPDQALSGAVRLVTTEGLAALLVRRGLLDVSERHPGLVIELLGGNQTADLARGEADLALRVTPVKERDIRVRRVLQMRVALFASTGYLARRGRPRRAEELAGHAVVLPAGELARMPEAAWLARQPGVRVAFRSNSLPALVEAAASGAGLVALTRPWGDRVPGLERLFELALPARSVWLALHPAAARRASVRAVADRVVEVLASMGD